MSSAKTLKEEQPCTKVPRYGSVCEQPGVNQVWKMKPTFPFTQIPPGITENLRNKKGKKKSLPPGFGTMDPTR